jgi:hypothetical protein
MADRHVFKISKGGESCCESNTAVHQIINWTYTPKDNGVDSIAVVENTVWNNNPFSFVFIEGNNFLDQENNIKGNLEIRYRCVEPCDLMLQKSFTPLRLIQVGGPVLAIDGPRGYKCLPYGDDAKIKVQAIGGFGTYRRAFSSNSKVASVGPTSTWSGPLYRPEMQILGPHQVNSNCWAVDESLNQNSDNVFTIKLHSPGFATITVVDEGGCSSSFNIYVPYQLSEEEHGIIENKNIKTNYEPSFQDKLWNDASLMGGDNKKEGYFTREPKGKPFQKTYTWGISAGLKINAYSDDDFISGTTTINKDGIVHANILTNAHVGEEVAINMPEHGRWRGRVVNSSGEGNWNLTGHDSKHLLGWGHGSDKHMVKLRKSGKNTYTAQCIGPTNHTPVLLHFYETQSSVIGPPNPIVQLIGQNIHKEVQVKNDGSGGNPSVKIEGDAIVLTRWNGERSKAESVGGVTQKPMTGASFFVFARCFCTPGLMKETASKQSKERGEKFDLQIKQSQLKSNKSWYFAPNDVGVNTKLFDSLIVPPNKDDLAPQRQPKGTFKLSKKDDPAFTLWQTPWVFWSEANQSFAQDLEYNKSFESQYFKDGEFYTEDGNKGIGKNHHSEPKSWPYRSYISGGVTDQPRGSWCVYNDTFKIINKTPVAVLLLGKDPKMLRVGNQVLGPKKVNEQEYDIKPDGNSVDEGGV